MKTSSKTLFFMMMLLSSMLVLNSSSWINMWMGLEVNLMSFIPLMSTPKNSFKSQSIMMYFLMQSMASMIFIFSILMEEYLSIFNMEMMKMLITLSMMMKLGMPPFHMWFPEVMNKMNWTMCFMLMSWQKIAPMYILSIMINLSSIIIGMVCLSSMIGAIGGINQTSTRKIMAYSSINHMSWMIACCVSNKKSWIIYLILYSMIMLSMTMMMHTYNIIYINQMNLFSMKNLDKMIIIMMMMSMGGIPPFLGFIPKWITIQYMIPTKEMFMLTIMIMSALITLTYYLRLSTHLNLMKTHSQKWIFYFKTKKNIMYFMLMLNLMLPMTILLFNFY